jgi:hypothetical protein
MIIHNKNDSNSCYTYGLTEILGLKINKYYHISEFFVYHFIYPVNAIIALNHAISKEVIKQT